MTPRSVCVILPAFNEARRIGPVLEKIRTSDWHVVLVDDGSTDETARIASGHGAAVISHGRNTGKGAALLSGFSYARTHGYEVVITMDADGQHDPGAIPLFLETFARTGIPVLIGNRMWQRDKIPRVRRWTNMGMSRLLSRIMGVYVPDTQCGFRLYRADLLDYIHPRDSRFALESEILLLLARRGFRMDSVRIPVIYEGQVSRINPLPDTLRFLRMLVRYYRDRTAAG